MGFLSGLFKDKKKDASRNTSAHEHHHHHHQDAAVSDDKPKDASPSQPAVAPTPRAPTPQAQAAPHVEHSKELPQRPNELLPEREQPNAPQRQETPQPAQPPRPPAASYSDDQAKQPRQNPQRSAQTQQEAQMRLKPAYRYTGGEFSETISREEAMLAKQYNFAAADDRAHAEVTTSANRRTVAQGGSAPANGGGAMKDAEFDSIFNQFMHGTSDK